MSEVLHAFHFLHPGWLLGLLGVPALGWLTWRRVRADEALTRLVDPALRAHVLTGQPRDVRLPLVLALAGGVLAVLALAGPSWTRQPQPLYAGGDAQVVAISLSSRMLARDVAPSRLDRARFKARDLMAANRAGRNALIAYAGEAFVVAPLTSDAASLDELLDALSPDTMPADGDNAAQAIERGAALITRASSGGGSLVLLTDRVDDAAVAAARRARTEGVRVSVLGIGTPQGGPVPLGEGGFLHDERGNLELARRDDASLAELAAAGGGRYVPATDDRADVRALHDALAGGDAGRARSADGAAGAQWQDGGAWLLLPLLAILALGFRRGWLLPLAVLVLLPALSTPARADGWQDLWLRRDQQASRALRQGDAARARQLARDPALRGAADYRAGDYAAAARELADQPGADAQYNLGNALARQGEYEQAIAAYDRALAADPGHADARANRQAVADWLARQNKAQDQDKNDKDRQGQNGKGQPQDGSQRGGDPQQGQGQPGQPKGGGKPGQRGEQDARAKPGEGQDAPRDAGQAQGEPAAPQTAEQRAAAEARAEAARKALAQQMDRALDKSRRDAASDPDRPHQLGLPDDGDPTARLPAEVRQALQRVPDDPGALLRRKFELEYRRRHAGGGTAADGAP